MSEHEHTHNGHAHEAAAVAAISEHTKPVAPLVLDKEVKFSFKKQMIQDELGQEVKRPMVSLQLPIPTFDGLIAALEDPKAIQFVLDLVEAAVIDQARLQVSDEEKPVNRQDELDLTKLDLKYIANIPKSERTGGGIAKEVWEEFESNYVEVMGANTEKGEEKLRKAAKLLVAKFTPVRTEKNVIKFLREQLGFWYSKTPAQEEFAEVYKFLDEKAGTLLQRDSSDLLASL